MKTSILNTFHLSKRILALAGIVLGLGMGAAHATSATVMTEAQAKVAAAQIVASSNPYNAAVTIAEAATAGTSSADAVLNAALIVKYLPEKFQRIYAGRVGVGVALNFPNQLPQITLGLAILDKNIREHVSSLVYQLTLAGGFDQASQIALVMGDAIRLHGEIGKQVNLISIALLSGIYDRANVAQADRANELAFVAGNLAKQVLVPDKHNKVTKSQIRSLKIIQANLANYLKLTGASDPNALRSALANFGFTLKNSLGGVSPKVLNAILDGAQQYFLAQFPGSTTAVTQAFTAVANNDTSSISDPGNNVNHPESPAVDPSRPQ